MYSVIWWLPHTWLWNFAFRKIVRVENHYPFSFIPLFKFYMVLPSLWKVYFKMDCWPLLWKFNSLNRKISSAWYFYALFWLNEFNFAATQRAAQLPHAICLVVRLILRLVLFHCSALFNESYLTKVLRLRFVLIVSIVLLKLSRFNPNFRNHSR